MVTQYPETAVEVFKTGVKTRSEAEKIIRLIATRFPSVHATVDIMDCDKVLRVVGPNPSVNEITQLVVSLGIPCELME